MNIQLLDKILQWGAAGFLVLLFFWILYRIELGIDRRKTSEINPMSVKTTYPAYKPPFNLWISWLQQRGTYVSMNKQHEI